jgi:hypothetical protein
MFSIFFSFDTKYDSFKISFLKIPDLLANVGSMLSIIMFIFEFISGIYNSILMSRHIYDAYFNFRLPNDKYYKLQNDPNQCKNEVELEIIETIPKDKNNQSNLNSKVEKKQLPIKKMKSLSPNTIVGIESNEYEEYEDIPANLKNSINQVNYNHKLEIKELENKSQQKTVLKYKNNYLFKIKYEVISGKF